MNYTFKEFLVETKLPPKLYHLTNLEGMEGILKTNTLTGKNYTNISTTRDPTLKNYAGARAIIFRIVLDSEKLSKKYKLKNVIFKSRSGEKFTSEQETEIDVGELGKIVNIDDYIIEIQLIKPELDKLDDLFNPKSNEDYINRLRLSNTAEDIIQQEIENDLKYYNNFKDLLDNVIRKIKTITTLKYIND